jgi:hypothetical protein
MARKPRKPIPTLIVDISCGHCERAGDPNPPRLVRFTRWSFDEDVYVDSEQEWSTTDRSPSGRDWIPGAHRRPDGGITWELRCPQGHYQPIRHDRFVSAVEELQVQHPGITYMQLSF